MKNEKYLRRRLSSSRFVVCPFPGHSVVASAVSVRLSVPQALPVAPVRKLVETWSLMVGSKRGTSSKEVVNKVDPTLGVRVLKMKEVRDVGGGLQDSHCR